MGGSPYQGLTWQAGRQEWSLCRVLKKNHSFSGGSDVSSYSVLLWIINDVLFKLVKSVLFSKRVIPIRITYRLLALLHRYNLWVTRRVGILQVYQTKYEVQQQSLWESKWFEYKAWLSASPIQSFGAWWETGSFLARWERWVIFLLLWVRYLFNSWMLFLSKEQYLLFCCLVQKNNIWGVSLNFIWQLLQGAQTQCPSLNTFYSILLSTVSFIGANKKDPTMPKYWGLEGGGLFQRTSIPNSPFSYIINLYPRLPCSSRPAWP